MSSLQDLVPPVELCKLIPKGSFSKSALYWEELAGAGMDVFPRECGHCPSFDVCDKDAIPAPTFDEILDELHKCQEDVFVKWSETAYRGWLVNAYSNGRNEDYQAHDESKAIAALRLWLKLKGIEE